MTAWPAGRFASVRATAFRRLVEHFFQGLFRLSGDSSPSEYELSPSGLLGLLAKPGAFMALSLFGKYSSLLRYIKGDRTFDIYTASLPDKYFFIVFSDGGDRRGGTEFYGAGPTKSMRWRWTRAGTSSPPTS